MPLKPIWSRPRLPIAVAAVCVVLLWLTWSWNPARKGEAGPHQQSPLAARPAGGDFRLQTWDGPVSLAALRGKVVVIYFGYTWCPDICPTNLAIISLALKQLSPRERHGVQVLFVSVDPARDSVARLKTFVEYFDPGILGMTGSEQAIADVARRYGAAYRRSAQGDSAMGYTVDHSSFIYLVDPQGRLAEILAHATPADRMVDAIRSHLDSDFMAKGS